MGHLDKRITLSPELAAEIDSAVKAGEFASKDEAIADALRDWKERRENHGYSIAELRRAIHAPLATCSAREVASTRSWWSACSTPPRIRAMCF